ncbi:hypothetical protein EHS39_29015 [Ensifer sp. MPMI2T]|nr:hypothetical protein EHS39_29015 [Ensifer sp. MPMI2T]
MIEVDHFICSTGNSFARPVEQIEEFLDGPDENITEILIVALTDDLADLNITCQVDPLFLVR